MKEKNVNYHELSCNQDIDYRNSGYFLAGIVTLIYGLLLIRGKHLPYLLLFAAIIILFARYKLLPLRKVVDLLIGLGGLMQIFTNPLIFGIIYIVAVLPTAIFIKMIGKDILRLNSDSKSTSYWEERIGGKTWKDSFRKQF